MAFRDTIVNSFSDFLSGPQSNGSALHSEFGFGNVIFFVVSSILLAFAIWKVILYPKVFSPLRHFPAPYGGTLLNGQLWRILREPTGLPMREWINSQPNDGIIRFTTVCNQERLLLTSPEALKEVMVLKSYDWDKPEQMRIGLGRIVGHGVLLASGEEHKRQRKHLLPAFAPRVINGLVDIFWSKGCHMVDQICLFIKSGTSEHAGNKSSTAVVNMSDWLRRATLDIIGTAGMGYDFNALEEPESKINLIYDSVFSSDHNEKLMLFIETMENLVPVTWLGQLPIEHNRVVYEGAKAIRELAAVLIAEKKKPFEQEKSSLRKDVLGVAVDSGEFSDDGLVDQVMTFLAAGHETVSTSMVWALVSLCEYPHMQRKLRAEIRSGLSSPNRTDRLDHGAFGRLPYLQAVCNEVLRYHTPVPLSRRTSVRDTSILGNHIPKNTNILLVPAAINFSKALWGADALEFNPERWMQPNCSNSGGSTSNFANISFMHGPRSCIGMTFAKTEFACLLAAVVGRFEMEFAEPKRKIETLGGGAIRRLKGDLKLRITDAGQW